MESVLTPESQTPKVEPLCPVFGQCGGCAYQHLPYEEELRLKTQELRQLFFDRLFIEDNRIEPVVASPEPYHYRHRLDLTMKRGGPEGIRFGFQNAETRRMIPVESCAISRREISDFLPELKRQAIAKLPDDYRTANVVVRTGTNGKVYWGGIGRRSLVMKEADYLCAEVRGRKIFYSLETFFQANLYILPLVMEKLEALCSWNKETSFFDLYSGVGLFGFCFADRVQSVIMIEDNSASAQIAEYNRRFHGFQNVTIYSGKLEAELAASLQAAPAGRRVAIVDPPRQGLSESALEALSQSKSFETFFYLSCHPESLVRDLAVFQKRGWTIEKVVPFDFFPRTKHLETLVMMKP